MSNISHFLEQIMQARYGKDVRQSIHDAIQEIDAVADTAQDSATASAKAAADTLNMTVAMADSATASAKAAADSAAEAESYAHGGTGTREDEDLDNAKRYYEQAKQISQGMSGLIPIGTITFAELAYEDNQVAKYMFNISEEFVTDDTFKEGSGYKYPAGTNVYRTADGYWDCLAGAFLALNGDSKDNAVTFASQDSTSPTAWTDVTVLTSGEKHSSLFNKISTMIKNIRWLYKMLGTTDISAIGDGTCTGALSTLNTNLNSLSYTGLPDAVTGSFGNYVNVKAGAFKHGKFAVLCFSGQVTGIVDISLTAFGLDKSAKVSAIFTSECTIAKTDGTNGGTLTVKCYGNNTSLQLRSSVDGDYYTALIPVLLN